MRVGFDLDNTIVCYDQAIARLAEETLSLPETVQKTKSSLRDYLRSEDREDEWTEFQGRLYGPGMAYAKPYPNAIEIIEATKRAGHTAFIISHRSRHPYAGPKYDLHESAKNWIGNQLNVADTPLFPTSDIYLNETRDQKIALVASLECDVFIDDLIEVLEDDSFPASAKKVLFAPQSKPADGAHKNDVIHVREWTELKWLGQKDV